MEVFENRDDFFDPEKPVYIAFNCTWIWYVSHAP
jgi:hypothetical protein